MIVFFQFILFVGLFIAGMLILRSALFSMHADSVRKWLINLTNTHWKGLLTGTFITAILQSSSAVTVITVGLVSANLLTFHQTIGIILGTNIGTTITAEIITLDINNLLIPMALIGGAFSILKNKIFRSIGHSLIGLTAVFTAMWGFEYVATPLQNSPYISQMLLSIDGNHLYAILAGAIISALIHSSSATTGIVMGFLTAGTMGLDTGIAIILGANIGTCVDALFASLVSGKASRLTAYAHIWLNVLGVIAFFPLINFLADLGHHLAVNPAVQLAHISVIFNVACSLIVLPFANQFAKFILFVHDRKRKAT